MTNQNPRELHIEKQLLEKFIMVVYINQMQCLKPKQVITVKRHKCNLIGVHSNRLKETFRTWWYI